MLLAWPGRHVWVHHAGGGGLTPGQTAMVTQTSVPSVEVERRWSICFHCPSAAFALIVLGVLMILACGVDRSCTGRNCLWKLLTPECGVEALSNECEK